MKRLLIALVLVVAGGVGLGFYLNWFRIDYENGSGKTQITFTVDWNKISASQAAAEAEPKH